jgi:exopolysaccharide biosynthesis operon protein EpsL
MADPDDTLSFVVGGGLMHDDNLFRAPAGQENSDLIRSLTAGLKFDKEYSLQRFKVDASLTDYNYQDNSYLNYTGKNLNAAWLWKLSPQLYGNLSTSRVDTLNSFVDYTPTSPDARRNIRTTKSSRFDVEWEALGPLHLISAVSHYDQENSQVFVQDDNYTAGIGELGVKYVTSTESWVALVQRKTQGDYARPADPTTALDSGFDQTDTEARFSWNPTVKTNVFGRVAYIDRKFDHFAERNYDGVVGSVDFNWGLTEKLSLLLSARRDLNVFQELRSTTDSYSSFYSSDMFTISPAWEISEKTLLRLRLSRENRDYDGTVVNGMPLRTDRLNYSGVTFEWWPRKSINMNLGYLHQSRDSNNDSLDFKDNIYSLSLILNF